MGHARPPPSGFPGVPYAALPRGASRMRRPQPVVPWRGARAAARTGPTARQGKCPLLLRCPFPFEHAVALGVDGGPVEAFAVHASPEGTRPRDGSAGAPTGSGRTRARRRQRRQRWRGPGGGPRHRTPPGQATCHSGDGQPVRRNDLRVRGRCRPSG
ncbi:carboxylesterase family protein [Streptomyces sp. MBT67]|nr:carboxylesterase family protein [Streptomyces sp. MBT72]MBK3534685.1 carboxylesterase family protein [Streptomyces sp. MBT67]MBK3541497.1 carboxylesterase family protein [Streptomyces sp. MBT60]MBK3548342.1 carboxylesterase family protein [Streptomyces sp. MBT61]MBK6027202.1 carboxylesterase family protein [Streptomyces sp. MBT59]